jgi:hypothetical protein
MIEIETERTQQMQRRAAVRAQANHVAGVRRDLRLIENDMQHLCIIGARRGGARRAT